MRTRTKTNLIALTLLTSLGLVSSLALARQVVSRPSGIAPKKAGILIRQHMQQTTWAHRGSLPKHRIRSVRNLKNTFVLEYRGFPKMRFLQVNPATKKVTKRTQGIVTMDAATDQIAGLLKKEGSSAKYYASYAGLNSAGTKHRVAKMPKGNQFPNEFFFVPLLEGRGKVTRSKNSKVWQRGYAWKLKLDEKTDEQ